MLTAEQRAARENRLTASRVACLMTGDAERILNLWRELVGDPAYDPSIESDAVGDKWYVRLGNCTEPLQLDWYEFKNQRSVTRRGEVVIHPTVDWAACTLDGWDDAIPAPIECKHMNGFNPPKEQAAGTYWAQMTWQMIVCQTTKVVFSPIFGSSEPAAEVMSLDQRYADELWRRAEAFMRCVRELRQPVALPGVNAEPVRAEKVYDMRLEKCGNEWGDKVATYIANQGHAAKFDEAKNGLKQLVPADAARAFGNGIIIKRDARGALRFSLEKAA